jgi:hypothetical protein
MQGTQVVVELLPWMQIAVICWPWDVTGGRNIDYGVTGSVLQALADVQLHCLAATGSPTMCYATHTRDTIKRCCSNLVRSGAHVH